MKNRSIGYSQMAFERIDKNTMRAYGMNGRDIQIALMQAKRMDWLLSEVMKGINEYYKKFKFKGKSTIEPFHFPLHISPNEVEAYRNAGYEVKEWNGKEYV